MTQPSTATLAPGLRQGDIAFQANLYNDPNPTRRWLHTTRRDWIEGALAHYTAAPRTRVLEVGVGAGLYTRYLSSRSCEILAVDINADFLNGVSDLPGVMVSCADATRRLSVGDFDVALCSEVLEHVLPQDSMGMLQSLFNALRPGGVLILTTPQQTSTMERFVRLLKFGPAMALARMVYGTVDDLGHINVLTARQLKDQIALTGFEVLEHTQHGLYLPVVAEFGGKLGQRFAAWFERRLRNRLGSRWLWTQAYVLRRPA